MEGNWISVDVAMVIIGQVHVTPGCSSGRFSVTSSCPFHRTDPSNICYTSSPVSSCFYLSVTQNVVFHWLQLRLCKKLLLKLPSDSCCEWNLDPLALQVVAQSRIEQKLSLMSVVYTGNIFFGSVPGSFSGATRFSEKLWVSNGVHLAS
jgi:hypothetical protein